MVEPALVASPRPRRLRSLDATDLARVAVFAAIVVVFGLPGGFMVLGFVPITAQTLGVMLAGAILGPWLGALSVTVVLALTAVGLPFLAGGRGGMGVFLGPSAGFALGWILGAIVVGLIVHLGRRKPGIWRTGLGMAVGGILAIYGIGIPVQSLVTRLPFSEAALTSLVFVPGDIVKVVIATFVVITLLKAYPRAFRRVWPEDRVAAAEDYAALLP